MQVAVAGMLGVSFRKGVNEDAYRRAVWRHRDQQERERRQKQNEFREDASDLADIAAAIIATKQAAVFRLELEAYDAATVEALQMNQEALDLARERLLATLARAHVLEDGRRVFKTADGTQVFDEHGEELGVETIAPDEIADDRPTWEQFKAERDAVRALEAEQSELLHYQSELDAAAELLDSGEMTQDQFDEMRTSLRENAPEAVRARIHGASNDVEHQPSINLDLDAELAIAIKPTAPGLGG